MNTRILAKMGLWLVVALLLGFIAGTGHAIAGEPGKDSHAQKAQKAQGAAAEQAKLKPQTTCPIMGGKIDKNLYVDFAGKRIYACCPACVKKIKADPEAALKTLAARGEEAESLEPEQKLCPVMGGKINKNLFVEYQGKKIYVCCPTCLAKVKQDPAKYAAKVAADIKAAKAKAAEALQGGKAAQEAGDKGHPKAE